MSEESDFFFQNLLSLGSTYNANIFRFNTFIIKISICFYYTLLLLVLWYVNARFKI